MNHNDTVVIDRKGTNGRPDNMGMTSVPGDCSLTLLPADPRVRDWTQRE